MNIVFGLIVSAVAGVLVVLIANVMAYIVDGRKAPELEKATIRTDDNDRILCCASEEGADCGSPAVVVQAFVTTGRTAREHARVERGARRIRYPWVACLRHSCGESRIYLRGLGDGDGVTLFLDLNGFTLYDLAERMDPDEVSEFIL